MNSSSANDLARDQINNIEIQIQSTLAQKTSSSSSLTRHHHRKSSKHSSNSSSSKLDKSKSPTKEHDLKISATNLLEKIYKHLDYTSWREGKNAFLKGLRCSFDEFFERVNEQLERIIKQQETYSLFERHKATMKIISQKGNAALEEEINFFKNQCSSGKLEKELQILEQSKSLKQNILVDFYADIARSIDNLKNTDLVLLEKLKQPDQIIRHEPRRDPLMDNINSFNISYPSKLKLKPLEIPLSLQTKSRQSSNDSQKSLNSTTSKNSQQLDSPNISPMKMKSPQIRSRFRNMTASPCTTPLSPSNDNIRFGFQIQNSPQLQSQSSSQHHNQHCFQGKKIYNFEFSLEETQSVLLKNENELILIGEQIKIWDNQQRRITYEKKIEQVHELHGKKYSIGWGQFSVLDNKHVIIGNNNTKQIFLFSINPFRLIKVLEEDIHHNSYDSISPLTSPPPLSNQRRGTNNFNLNPSMNNPYSNNSLNNSNIQQHISNRMSFDTILSDNVFQQELQQIIQNQHFNENEIENDDNEQDSSSRQYGHFVKIDENIMACCCSNNKIQVWNIKTHQLIHTMKVGSSHQKINRLIKLNKQIIASHCESDNRIRLWNCLTGKQQRKAIHLPTKMIQNMWTFRNFLYIVSFKNTIYVYNLNSLKLIKYLQLPFQIVLSKQLSEDYIVGVQNYNEVFILSLKDFSFKKVIKMEFQITDIIIFNSRVFATFNICSESRKGKIEYLQ